MSRSVGAVALLGTHLALPCGALGQTREVVLPQVVVVSAREACFSSTIPVTGFLTARKEAVVILVPGEEVVEVLVSEGDTVASNQALARVTRPVREPPRPGLEPRTETVALNTPAPGTVIRSTAAVGSAGSPVQAEPLFRIAVDGEVELEADVPSIRVPELSVGQVARVLVEDATEPTGRELTGRVRLTPASIDPRTQLGRARISLGRNPQLRFATFARASIDARRSCGLSIPRAAVTYRTGGTSVQVVVDDLIATRNVGIGLHADLDVEITSGLAAGDRVVANAGTSLRDGDRVKPVEEASSPTGER